MNRTFRIIALFASGTIVLSFVVLVVNQTAQVVQLATTISPILGKVTLVGLLATYATLVGVPLVMVVRLPSPLTPPESETCPEFETHLKKLGERLAASPHTSGHDLSRRHGIEEALAHLSAKSDQIVRETATAVFLSTAVSQSGRLDAILVVMAQSRMVWKIAHTYYQRPSARDMVHLYANVAGTAFLAGELQDLDLGQQVEPVISAAIGALGATVPGLHVASTILAGCVLDGSANAFLTLRVGMIAKRYCGALVVEPKGVLRRAATAEAARHLGAIVSDGSARLTKAFWRTSVGKVGGAVSGATDRVKDAGARFLAKVRGGSGVREQPEVG
jgi:Domain of unknown function (DUF697)